LRHDALRDHSFYRPLSAGDLHVGVDGTKLHEPFAKRFHPLSVDAPIRIADTGCGPNKQPNDTIKFGERSLFAIAERIESENGRLHIHANRKKYELHEKTDTHGTSRKSTSGTNSAHV
jgi:hypothetical protein